MDILEIMVYIHSQAAGSEILLDSASYKLYYVNYGMGFPLRTVCILFKNPRTPESQLSLPSF